MIKNFLKKNLLFNPFALTIFSISLAASIVKVVDLQPHVDNEFFFSSDSPQFQSEKRISRMFPLNSQVIVSARGDIYSPEYLRRIKCLAKDLASLAGVTGVKSLVDGPDSVDIAVKGPLWNRMLISSDKQASNIMVFIDNVKPQEIIPRVERIVSYYNVAGFEIKIAGFAFVVELIRRNLVHDLTVFSAMAIIAFTLMMAILFRSTKIVAGALTSCLNACLITLVISQLLGVKIGILTANLFTIVFVLTLSHVVFLTNNWFRFKAIEFPDSAKAARAATGYTFQGSFWCMFTTLLGFASLIFVPAKPLKELGVSGSIGTFISIVCAYCIYPLYLCSIKKDVKNIFSLRSPKVIFVGHYMWATVILAFFTGVCIMGINKLNTDPSLLTYFKQKSELRQGLEYIDLNGGSSPLNLVVSDFYSKKLNTDEAYKRLWALQNSLENDPDIGSVISLPVLIAEGRRNPFANLISNETLLRILEEAKHDKVANAFVTTDRKYAHFFMRMKETGRTTSRLEVVERIKQLVYQHKFKPEMAGGIYVLQGELSRMVATSLIDGLLWLVLLFVIIGYIVSRSVKIALAMAGGLSIIATCMLGVFGNFRIPLDTISASATNIAIGMGIDSMIHMVIMMRRFLAKEDNFWQAWRNARFYLWQPVISSMLIIVAGFGIFIFSMFPPNQRFGLAVVFGSILAAPMALFVLPSVVGPWFYKE